MDVYMPQLASRTTILYCCHFQIHWMYALTTNVWVGRGRVWIRIVCPQLLNNQPLMFMVAKTRSSRCFAARMHEAAAEVTFLIHQNLNRSCTRATHVRERECMHAAADHDGTYVHEPHRPRPGSRWIIHASRYR